MDAWSDFELNVIEAVKVYYESNRHRQIDWKKEAKKLPNTTGPEMKKRWKSIRDKYRRRQKNSAVDAKLKYNDSKLFYFLGSAKAKDGVLEPDPDDEDQPLSKKVDENLKKYLESMQKERDDALKNVPSEIVVSQTVIENYIPHPKELRRNTAPIEYYSIINIDYRENNTQTFFEKLSDYVIKRFPPEKYQEIKTDIRSILDNAKSN